MNKKIFIFGGLSLGLLLSSCGDGGGGSNTIRPDTGGKVTHENLASGIFSYADASYQEKNEILGKLESYALQNHLAGIPLYDNSSFELFSDRITLPTTTYITNYGFGTVQATIDKEGNVNNGKINESVEEWRSYFHGYTSIDSGTFNYWDSEGADVADRSGMISASYYDVKMNSSRTDYEWKLGLATEMPIMIDKIGGEAIANPEDGRLSKFWRIKVRTNVRYSVPKTSVRFEEYDNTLVKLEDYLTPFKAIIGDNLSRAANLIADASGFAGAYDYAYGSGTRDWKNVGIQLNEKEQALDFEFVTAKSQYYARTNLSSGLYSPVPEKFIKDCGGSKNYAKKSPQKGLSDKERYETGFDNIISLGSFIPTYWEGDSMLVYKKNPRYFDAENVNLEGYTEKVISGSGADVTAFNKFLNNELDEVTIPTKHIKDYKNKPKALQTKGSTIIKLNLNSCTREEWQYYFGPNGKAAKHDNVKDFWPVKAIMSNDDFLDGLFFAIDRKTLADTAGKKPAISYLSDAYTSDPDGKEFYRQTPQGKAVLQPWIQMANDENCYSESVASDCFKRAVASLIKNEEIQGGDTITIKSYYRYQDTIDNIGNTIKTKVEKIFNEACKSYNVTLEIDNAVGGQDYTETYNKMDRGEYDIAEGAISGNVLNPLQFMSTICTDNLSEGFCLNWGDITARVNDYNPLKYDGKEWSYDALWSAANATAIVYHGVVYPIANNSRLATAKDASGNDVIEMSADYPWITDDKGIAQLSFTAEEAIFFVGSDSKFSKALGNYMPKIEFTYDSSKVEEGTILGIIKLTAQLNRFKGALQNATNNMGVSATHVLITYKLRYKFGGTTHIKDVSARASLEELGIGVLNPA